MPALDEQAAKNGKRQYLFINEANGVPYPIAWQLMKRTRVRTFLDYNPTIRFWCHDRLIGTDKTSNDLGANVKLIISDHRHNPFLRPEDHLKTESIKDKELWRVYARGLTGNISGIIYPDWQRISDEQWNEIIKTSGRVFAGLDFGYTNDPTAGVVMARIGESIYVKEICYTPGITPIQSKQLL